MPILVEKLPGVGAIKAANSYLAQIDIFKQARIYTHPVILGRIKATPVTQRAASAAANLRETLISPNVFMSRVGPSYDFNLSRRIVGHQATSSTTK